MKPLEVFHSLCSLEDISFKNHRLRQLSVVSFCRPQAAVLCRCRVRGGKSSCVGCQREGKCSERLCTALPAHGLVQGPPQQCPGVHCGSECTATRPLLCHGSAALALVLLIVFITVPAGERACGRADWGRSQGWLQAFGLGGGEMEHSCYFKT